MSPRSRRIGERWLPWTLAWLLLAFLFVPVLVVVPVALTAKDYLSLPTSGISLQH
ncbi:MAG: ABC transporter permease, partial [Mesorhizobium sp.]